MTKLRFPMTDWKEPKFMENGGQELIDKSLDLCYLQLHRVLYGQAWKFQCTTGVNVVNNIQSTLLWNFLTTQLPSL